jgi:hypothetical protein
MRHGLSDQVRALAMERYIEPAKRAGKMQFAIAVRDLMQELRPQGFPADNWRQVCTAIRAEKFLRSSGLEIESVDGPPSKSSPTVVVRYRVAIPGAPIEPAEMPSSTRQSDNNEETPEERAHRLTGKIFGLLKDELAEYGGGEAFLRWIRSDDDEAVL